ncbi:MAG: hypothetical protein IPJ28_11085 [Betaproteobacteria bacterium]|nr:hypothetical protein [Betaproteobacteria bacterium]
MLAELPRTQGETCSVVVSTRFALAEGTSDGGAAPKGERLSWVMSARASTNA